MISVGKVCVCITVSEIFQSSPRDFQLTESPGSEDLIIKAVSAYVTTLYIIRVSLQGTSGAKSLNQAPAAMC